MMVLLKVSLRNIKANFKWAMMTISGIAISVMLVATIIMFGQGAYEQSSEEILQTYGEWNVLVESSSNKIPDSDYILDSLVRTKVGEYLLSLDGSEYGSIYEVVDFEDPSIEKFITLTGIVEGRRPSSKGEVAVGKDLLYEDDSLEIGSLITYTDLNGLHQEVEIVGVLEYSSYIQVNGYASEAPSQIHLKIDPSVPDFEKEIKRMFPNDELVYNTIVNQMLGLQSGLNPLVIGIASLCVFIIVLISLASVTLIYNSFNLSIENKVKQLGIIQSIGATKKQISLMVYFEGFILATLGISLGVLLGVGLSSLIANILTIRFNELSLGNVVFEPVINLMVILLIYLAGYVSVFLPIRKSVKKANKVSTIETIRQSDVYKGKEIKTPKYLNFEGQLAYKNIKRDKSKHKATTISLVVTMVILIALNSVVSMMKTQIELVTPDNSYDLTVRDFSGIDDLSLLLDDINSDLYQDARHYKSSVVNIEESGILDAQLQTYKDAGYKTTIFASYLFIEDEDYNAWVDDLGLDSESSGGVFLNKAKGALMNDNTSVEVELKDLNFRVGDELALDGKDNKIKVKGIVDELPWGIVGNVMNLSINIVLPMSQLDEYIEDEMFVESVLIFKAEDHKTLEEGIGKAIENRKMFSAYISNQTESQQMLNAIVGSGTLIMYIIAGFIALICISNVINVVVSGLRVRKSENAIFRSVGMLNKDIRKMLVYESLMISGKPLIIGTILGIGCSFIAYFLLSMQIPLGSFKIDIMSLLISWIMVILVLLINIMYSLTYMGRNEIIQNLRSEAF